MTRFTKSLLGIPILVGGLWFSSIDASATLSQPPDWTLPKSPVSTDLNTEFPKCDVKGNLAMLRECLSDLELFRSLQLEPYNRSVQLYIKSLKDLDTKLEAAHGAKQVSAGDYSPIHKSISDELEKSSQDGTYMIPYYAFSHRYQDQVRIVQKQIKCLEFAGAGNCNT